MYEQSLFGGCQCGAVRYRVTGAEVASSLCHCGSCRRAHAAPAVAWALYREPQFELRGTAPREYESSPGVRRSFCAHCGTPVCFRASYIPGLVDIPIGSLDNPAAIRPRAHAWFGRKLTWLELADAWPRHEGFPPG